MSLFLNHAYSSYEYGPCIGMTRLQRWERADALGLNPPLAVSTLYAFINAF